MSTGLYRVYTKGDGYVTPIKKWEFVTAFVQAEDAEDWVVIRMNDVPPDEDIEYKIMKDGKNI